MFLDRVKIFAQAGDGGNGCVSFRREKYIPRGGPNGGTGGNGGDVYLEASRHFNTLYNISLKPHLQAQRGQHGQGANKTGRSGPDCAVAVPLGTVVYEAIQGKEARKLGELLNHGERLCIAKGGRGGRGNSAFKSSVNRAPRRVEKGQAGEHRTCLLELKLLADVGIIGLPNAGKSSLIARITAAKPKVADYPFTTLYPVLGVCSWKGRSFVLADIPGLIEGAHRGRGLGHEFLRHTERTKVLVHLVEPKGKEALKDFKVVQKELSLWSASLGDKPRLVAVTKADLDPEAAGKTGKFLASRLSGEAVLTISSQTGEGLDLLLDEIINRISSYAD
ncbi:MAG: GTPase ObgE [Elusimicrobia bacterium]|nr:GTPase ObgE [Elusimicrobiota bacterium]